MNLRRFRAWGVRLSGMFNKERRDRELAEELESHLQMHVEDNLRSGMTAEEARRRALIELGGLEAAKEECRSRRGGPAVENLLRSLRYALRTLRRDPGFTSVAVLTLALGVGATTAIFSVVYATLFEPLPYPKPDQLVMVWSKADQRRNSVSADDYLEWKHRSKSFQYLEAWSGGTFNVATDERREQVQAALMTPGFFRMTGTPMFLGRDFLPEEGEAGNDYVVVITHRMWSRNFGCHPRSLRTRHWPRRRLSVGPRHAGESVRRQRNGRACSRGGRLRVARGDPAGLLYPCPARQLS